MVPLKSFFLKPEYVLVVTGKTVSDEMSFKTLE